MVSKFMAMWVAPLFERHETMNKNELRIKMNTNPYIDFCARFSPNLLVAITFLQALFHLPYRKVNDWQLVLFTVVYTHFKSEHFKSIKIYKN